MSKPHRRGCGYNLLSLLFLLSASCFPQRCWSTERVLYLGIGRHHSTRLLDLDGEAWERKQGMPWIEGRLQWGPRVGIQFGFINAGYSEKRTVPGGEEEESADYSGNAWGLEYSFPVVSEKGSLVFGGRVTMLKASLVRSGGPLAYEWTSQMDVSAGYRIRLQGGNLVLRAAILASNFMLGGGTSLLSPDVEINQVAPGLDFEAIVTPIHLIFVRSSVGWIRGIHSTFSGGMRFK